MAKHFVCVLPDNARNWVPYACSSKLACGAGAGVHPLTGIPGIRADLSVNDKPPGHQFACGLRNRKAPHLRISSGILSGFVHLTVLCGLRI